MTDGGGKMSTWIRFIELQAILLLVLYGISFWMPEGFILTLVHSFAIQVLVAGVALSVWLLFQKRWIRSVAATAALVLISLQLPSWDSTSYSVGTTDLSVAHFNVLKFNEDHHSTIDAALNTGADLVSFQEVDRSWGESLERSLTAEYPYYSIESREDCYGLAVFSRYPLHDLDVIYFEGFPNIVGDVLVNDTAVHFIASHTRAPLMRSYFNTRNRQLEQITDYLSSIEGPKMAIGDYNFVPWDSRIQRFKSDTNMMDSRSSLTPTYPSGLVIARIPIDYIFHSEELDCLGFEAIEGTSSDHLGVIGQYALASDQP